MKVLYDGGTNRGYSKAYQSLAMVGRGQPATASALEGNKLKNRCVSRGICVVELTVAQIWKHFGLRSQSCGLAGDQRRPEHRLCQCQLDRWLQEVQALRCLPGPCAQLFHQLLAMRVVHEG